MNHNIAKPTLLLDKSKLPEIYKLRVLSWEESEQKEYINQILFPDGWKDKFDETAYHWIIEIQGNIIASSRVCIIQNIDDLEENFKQFTLPKSRPFAFFSRLVVHPAYRGLGLSKMMDFERLKFIKENHLEFTLASVEAKIGRKSSLFELGFEELGNFTHQYGTESAKKNCKAFILYHSKIKIDKL